MICDASHFLGRHLFLTWINKIIDGKVIVKTKTWGLISGLAAASIWGGMYVVSKVVLEVVSPFILLSLRLTLGILALGIMVAIRGGIKISTQNMVRVLGIGIVGYGFSLGLQFVGTKLSTAVNGAVVTSATPAFVFLFALIILREPISRRRFAALLVSTVGVLVVIDLRDARLTSDFFLGNLSLVAAALTWALYSVLIRRITRKLDTLPVSFIAFFGGLLISIPGGMWESNLQGGGEITFWIGAGIFYLGIISTALAAYLWNKSFELLDAGVASLTFFAQPVVGTLLGVTLLGEEINPLLLIGGGLIGFGLWLAAKEA